MAKLSAWLTRMINRCACTSGQSCLFMKWTAKGPSWLWYCEIERERNITILDREHNPVISLSYAMLSVSVARIDGELYHTETTLSVQIPEHQGSTSFSHLLCRQQVQAEDPSPGPWPLSARLKAFPQPEIKTSAQWQTSGCTDSRPGSKQGARGGREGSGGRERESAKGTLAKKEERGDSEEARGWVWGGESGKLVYRKGGEEVLQQRWNGQREADAGR